VTLMAETAMFSVVLLFLMMTTAFPAVLYMDISRQGANNRDCLCCIKVDVKEGKEYPCQSPPGGFFFQKLYSKVITSPIFQALIILIGLGLIGLAAYGVSVISVGLDLEEFFPEDSQGYRFAEVRKENFPSWPLYVSWGQIQYGDGDTQMRMVEAFEGVTDGERVTNTTSTVVWITQFALWGTRDCLGEDDATACGYQQTATYLDEDTPYDCTASWLPNTRGLALDTDNVKGYCKIGADICDDSAGDLEDDEEYCPVIDVMSSDDPDKHLAACMAKWYDSNMYKSGSFQFDTDCRTPSIPIMYSSAGSPQLYAIRLEDTDAYVDMIKDARSNCDDDDGYPMNGNDASDTMCFVDGIAVSYWEQYLEIETLMITCCLLVVLVALLIGIVFLSVELICGSSSSSEKGAVEKLMAALFGGLIIALILGMSLFATLGISSAFDVNLSAFSLISYLMSVGFAVEFSVHIVHRWLVAPAELTEAEKRVLYTMEMLSLPTMLAFVSSFVGILCMAFTDVKFIVVYFFVPLILVVCITFFYGAFFLPVILCHMKCDFFNLGVPAGRRRNSLINVDDKSGLKNDGL